MNDVENKQNNSSEGGMYEKKPQKSNKIALNKWAFAAICVAFALVFFLTGWFAQFYSIDPRMRSLMWIVNTIEKKYYKDVDLDELYGDLYEAAMPDIFSAYYTAEEYSVLVAESQGTSSNFGIAVNTEEETMRIARVVGNSSADRAGICVGMYLYRYGLTENDLQAGGYTELSSFLRGKAGKDILFECGFDEQSKQCYTVRSEEYLAAYCEYRDSGASFKFRGEEKLALEEVDAGLSSLPADTGYIRLYEFEGNAASEFDACLKTMNDRGRTNLVLDLRYNGGGYLTILQSIASHFLKNTEESEAVVATARYRNGKVSEFRATGENDYDIFFGTNSKITVLADEYSASASECLLGVLVDYGACAYGDIYLRRTDDGTAHSYGKGVMQSTYVTLKGDALRLTAAEIFWPSGKSIHGTGVTEADGAHAVDAPLLPSETDVFLEYVCKQLNAPQILSN